MDLVWAYNNRLHTLLFFQVILPEELQAQYEQHQLQAILDVRPRQAYAYRRLSRMMQSFLKISTEIRPICVAETTTVCEEQPIVSAAGMLLQFVNLSVSHVSKMLFVQKQCHGPGLPVSILQ